MNLRDKKIDPSTLLPGSISPERGRKIDELLPQEGVDDDLVVLRKSTPPPHGPTLDELLKPNDTGSP